MVARMLKFSKQPFFQLCCMYHLFSDDWLSIGNEAPKLRIIDLREWLVGNYHPFYEQAMEFIYIENLLNDVTVSITEGTWQIMARLPNLSSYEELSESLQALQTGLQPAPGQ